jgi:hypothetical protein
VRRAGWLVMPLLAWAVSAWAAPAPAPVPEVRWEVTPAAPRVGDVVTARLVVRVPAGVQVRWEGVRPEFTGLALTGTAPAAAGPGADARAYTLAADLPGTFRLPEVAVPWSGPDGSGAATAAAVPVTVAGAFDPESPPPPAPAKGPVSLAPPWGLYGAVAAAAVAVLAAALYLARRRRAAPRAVPPPAPAVPPGRVALERLAALDPDGMQPRVFYGALSAVARAYLEDRFGVPARARTTEEIAALVSGREGAPVADWLAGWDLAKFARLEPPREDARAALEAVRRWVRETGQGPGAERDA